MYEIEDELDAWHSNWLFNAAPGTERYVLVVWRKNGKLLRRETFLDHTEAKDALVEAGNKGLRARLFAFGKSEEDSHGT